MKTIDPGRPVTTVDDSEEIRPLVRLRLTRLGNRGGEAADGREPLKRLGKSRAIFTAKLFPVQSSRLQ